MQLVPGLRIGVPRHHAKNRLAQLGRQRRRVGVPCGVAPARLAEHAGVAERAQRTDEPLAQDRHGARLAGLARPADPRQRRREQRRPVLPERRAPLRRARVEVVELGEDCGDLAGHLRVRSGRYGVREVEYAARRLQPREAQRPAVRQDAELVDRCDRGEIGGDRRELRRCVQRAVVAALAGIDDHRSAAGDCERGPAVGDEPARGRRGGERRRDHGHAPAQRLLLRPVLAELALLEFERGALAAAGGLPHADQWHASLQREVVRDRRDRLARHRPDRLPQVVRDGAAVGMLRQVAAHARAPGVGADVAFQHADDRLALLVGDAVEGLVGGLRGRHVLHHGVRGGERIEAHGFLAHRDGAEPVVPFRMDVLDRAAFQPGGEALAQPQVVPPPHRHQVAEPLVCDLVSYDGKDALARGLGRNRRVEQHRALEVVDCAPVLHRVEHLAAAGARDVVELR